jgi:hypothetical protein
MPDFDTRQPQEEGQVDVVPEDRAASIANKVRTLLMANKLRAVLVGGVLFVAAAAVPLWLLNHPSSETHSSSESGPYVTCEGSTWIEEAECYPPGSSPNGIVRCLAPTTEAVTRSGRCRDEQWIEQYLGGD